MEPSELTKKRIKDYLEKGKRFDGRGPFDHRKIDLKIGVIKNAEGSAKVKFGDTEVLAGVKLGVLEPFPDQEDQGILITTAELLPLASSRFESGPPRIEAIELARIIDRGVRESGFVDFKKLCIKKKEKVWAVFIDLYPLNADGNLIDACALATAAAIKTAVFPKYDEKNEKVLFEERTDKKLPLTGKMPLTTTFHKIGEHIIVDPNEEEELSSDARVSIAITKDKELKINAAQKGGREVFTEKDLSLIIDNSVKAFETLNSKIKEAESQAKEKPKKKKK